MSSPETKEPRSGLAALRYRSFALFWLSRFLANFGALVISVSVGWQVYDLSHDPFDLGLVGLVQFAPALLLVLVTGTVSDRFNRRVIMGICQLVEGLCGLALLWLTISGTISVELIFAVLLIFGIARAFLNPASQSLVPNLVPPDVLASAIALSSSSWQVATIAGPVAGGLLYGLSPIAA
jgi:MFS family permease